MEDRAAIAEMFLLPVPHHRTNNDLSRTSGIHLLTSSKCFRQVANLIASVIEDAKWIPRGRHWSEDQNHWIFKSKFRRRLPWLINSYRGRLADLCSGMKTTRVPKADTVSGRKHRQTRPIYRPLSERSLIGQHCMLGCSYFTLESKYRFPLREKGTVRIPPSCACLNNLTSMFIDWMRRIFHKTLSWNFFELVQCTLRDTAIRHSCSVISPSDSSCVLGFLGLGLLW
jgi:hypothetical protein